MPILPIIYIVVASVLFGSGWYYGYSGEHDEVVTLEQQLNTINAQSAKLLNDAQAHNAELTANQLLQNAEIEKKYNETIKTNDSLQDQLADSIRLRRKTANKSGSCNAMAKAGDTSRDRADNAGGRYTGTLDTAGFSENFDITVSRKAFQADKVDAERRLMLDWIKSIPSDMVQ